MLDWDEAQAGMKIAGRNINNLRYADDTTLMAESEVELKKRGMLQSMGLHELDKTGWVNWLTDMRITLLYTRKWQSIVNQLSVHFSCSVVSTLCDPMHCSTLGFPVHHHLWSLIRLLSITLMMPSNHLILCCPLLLPSIFPRIRVFSNESDLHIRWPNCWSFSFTSVPPMNIQDWFPLGWTGWISLQSKRLSRVFSNTTVQ